MDLAHGVPTRFTFDPAIDLKPVWSPDGSHIVARSADSFALLLFDFKDQKWTALTRGEQFGYTNWSSDGQYVYYLRRGNEPAIMRVGISNGNVEQVADLNSRYGSPLKSDTEISHFHDLVSGQPYLSRCGLQAMAAIPELVGGTASKSVVALEEPFSVPVTETV